MPPHSITTTDTTTTIPPPSHLPVDAPSFVKPSLLMRQSVDVHRKHVLCTVVKGRIRCVVNVKPKRSVARLVVSDVNT